MAPKTPQHPYKYGRRPATGAPALMLGPSLTGVIPDHPAAVDYIGEGGWEMLGNDRYGDCVAVTWSNVRRTMGAAYPGINEVIALYETQNPGFPQQDNGMVIQTCLEHLVNEGGPDGCKAVCFAKVDHTNPDEVKAAIAIFGYVWTGIEVTQANEQQFANGEPWTYVPGSPVMGGHSVINGGYDTAGEKLITWAQETEFTPEFWAHQVSEAWVVVWPEHLTDDRFLAGVSVEQLAADYHELTGKTLPVTPTPIPPPAPTPPPAPSPEDAWQEFVEEIEAWIDAFFGASHPTAMDSRLAAKWRAYREAS